MPDRNMGGLEASIPLVLIGSRSNHSQDRRERGDTPRDLTSRSPRLPLSPIELLLPNGFAERAIVLGDACPSALAPAPSVQGSDGAPVDLVLLAPSGDQRRDPKWIQRAVHIAASRLSSSGMVYVVPSRAMSLRRALGSSGLHSAGTLLHVPDLARSRHVVPLGTAAERYALSGRLPMRRLKRFAATAALRSPWTTTLVPTGTLLRRPPAIPLAGWLFELEGSLRPPGSALLTVSMAAAGGNIVHRFSGGETVPDAVAKVSARANDELHGLLRVAPAAARAGARVPSVLSSGTLASVPLVLQSAVSGRPAALLIEQKHRVVRDLQERVATWLERWGRASAQVRELTHADLERFVLSPAIELAALATERTSYLEYLSALCSRAVGARCPFVPSHGDLTVANIVIDECPELGIVDWEEASEDSLPLMDFFYATADAVAAAHGYADRAEAFVSCFAPDGEHVLFLRALRRRLAGALGVDDLVQEVCFHACWLHHAANEAGRSADSRTGPFVTILQTIASEPERFRLAEATR